MNYFQHTHTFRVGCTIVYSFIQSYIQYVQFIQPYFGQSAVFANTCLELANTWKCTTICNLTGANVHVIHLGLFML